MYQMPYPRVSLLNTVGLVSISKLFGTTRFCCELWHHIKQSDKSI